MQLTGHHVFITGGGSGIGLALARQFLACGNRVTVCGRDPEKLEGAAKRHPGLETLTVDIAGEEGLRVIAGALTGPLATVSILVNNAAIGEAYCLQRDRNAMARIEAELSTDLLAPLRLTSLFLPQLSRCPEAAIVNITSGYALWPCAGVPGYSVAKAGLRAFSKVLRTQLHRSSVRVFEVLPPLVDTPLVSRVSNRKLSAETVAAKTIAGMTGDVPEIYIGEVRLLRWGLRFCPWLVERIMLRYPMDLDELDSLYP